MGLLVLLDENGNFSDNRDKIENKKVFTSLKE